jgi:hypothetical protein
MTLAELGIETIWILLAIIAMSGGTVAAFFKQREEANNKFAELRSEAATKFSEMHEQIALVCAWIQPFKNNIEQNISRLLMQQTDPRVKELLAKVHRRTITLEEIIEAQGLIKVWIKKEFEEKGNLIMALSDMLTYLEGRETELRLHESK